MVNECYLREGIRSFFKKKRKFISENFKLCQSRETRTANSHASSPLVTNCQLTASSVSCISTASERWGCSPELLPCLPSHLPKDARLFKTTPGRARECVGRGSSVGVDLALGSPFPRAACWIKGIGGISPSLCPVIGMQPFQ